MSLFHVGQKVFLASNAGITFEIVRVNLDQTFEIQVQGSAENTLKFDHVSKEMLQLVDASQRVSVK